MHGFNIKKKILLLKGSNKVLSKYDLQAFLHSFCISFFKKNYSSYAHSDGELLILAQL